MLRAVYARAMPACPAAHWDGRMRSAFLAIVDPAELGVRQCQRGRRTDFRSPETTRASISGQGNREEPQHFVRAGVDGDLRGYFVQTSARFTLPKRFLRRNGSKRVPGEFQPKSTLRTRRFKSPRVQAGSNKHAVVSLKSR